MQDGINHRRRVVAGERLHAGEHLVQQNAVTEEVGGRREFTAADLLGRHIVQSAFNLPPIIHTVGGKGLGQSEVEYLDLALRSQPDIVRFEIAVENTERMGRSQTQGQLHCYAQPVSGVEIGKAGTQGCAGYKFECYKGHVSGVFEFPYSNDMFGVNRGRLPSLVGQQVEVLRYPSEAVGDEFEGNNAPKGRIESLVDSPHAPFADRLENFILTQCRSGS